MTAADTEETGPEVLDPASTTAATEVQPVTYTGSAVVLDPIEQVLARCEERFANLAFDLTTTKGDKEARAARKELVEIRTGATKAYKNWSGPMQADMKVARDRVAEIERRVRVLEEPIDQQIKADEARRAAEKQERERLEAERVATIRKRIANIASLPTLAVDMDSENIGMVIEDLSIAPINEERFGEFLAEAQQLASDIQKKLHEMRESALRREAQAIELQRQQEELELQRKQIADQQAEIERMRRDQEEATRREEILREERARANAEKAARDAEDARRSAAGQTDAFAEERQQAVEVVKASEAQAREERRAPAPAPVSAPAAAPAPAPVQSAQQPSDDEINAAAAMAASDDRTDAAENLVAVSTRAFQQDQASEHAAAPEPQAPSAGYIVDLLAQAMDVQPDVALGWIRAVNWDAVTDEEIRHGQ